MTLENLKFEFRVIDKETGECLVSDFTYITPIDEFGGSDSVDIHTGSALRFVRRKLGKYDAVHG